MEFNSEDDLPLNKPLKFRPMTITIKSVSEEGGQFYLSNSKFFKMTLCMNYKNATIQKT